MSVRSVRFCDHSFSSILSPFFRNTKYLVKKNNLLCSLTASRMMCCGILCQTCLFFRIANQLDIKYFPAPCNTGFLRIHPSSGKCFRKDKYCGLPPFKFCVVRFSLVRIQYTMDFLFRNANCIHTFQAEQRLFLHMCTKSRCILFRIRLL